MIFTDIRLQNFRSYEDASFEISDTVTIVVGPNTAGKTNLLEGLLVAAVGKSYRTAHQNLIKDGQNWARIDAHTSDNSQRTVKITLESKDTTPNKTFEINDKIYKRLPRSLFQPIVLFEPNSLQLLRSEPANRRKYIDELAGQISDSAAKSAADYKRVLAQRNALLKSKNARKDIFVWDIRLSELADQIVKNRLQLISDINKSLSAAYNQIAHDAKTIEIQYVSPINIDNYGTHLLKTLQSDIGVDVARGFTGAGPHRDTIMFKVNGKSAETVSSRGETRTLLLALKTIELTLIEEARSIKPTLLLDDVFSELDGARRKALTDLIKNYQTIITTTDADIISKNFSQKAQLIVI